MVKSFYLKKEYTMKSYIALISDFVFSTITSFLILSVLFGYFIIYPFSLILSVMGTALFAIFFFNLTYSKHKKAFKAQKENKQKELTINALNLMKKEDLLSLFTKALNEKDYTVNEQNGVLFLPEKNACVFLFFEFIKVKKVDVLRAYNQFRDKKIAILSGEFSAEIKDFALRFKNSITLYDKDKIYSLLKETNCMPSFNEAKEQEKKPPLKQAFIEWIKKINSKKFFIFGISFLFFSYFAPIKLYYVICGSIFLILALSCKILNLYQKN